MSVQNKTKTCCIGEIKGKKEKMGFKKIKGSKVSEAVANQILGLIKKGFLKPGDKLPTENELGKSFGVSRTAIREGMQRLSALDIIEILPGKGTFIKQVKPSNEVIKIEKAITDKGSLLEVLKFRKVVESGIVNLAIDKLKKEDIQKLNKCITNHEKFIVEDNFPAEGDAAFHNVLALATHNKIIINFANEFLYPLILNSILGFSNYKRDYKKVLEDHKKIFDAVVSRDKEKASKALLEHLDWVIEIINNS